MANKFNKRDKLYSISNIQLRSVVNDEQSDDMIVEGYAIVFEQPTELYVDYDGNSYYEVIDKNSLDEAVMEDVPFKYNHGDSCFVPCRSRKSTGEGSLQLTVDDFGLKIRAQFANTTSSRDLYRLIDLGLINKMSFAFTIKEDSYDRETHTTKILKIAKLWDVSAVDDPAYPQTSLSSLRSAEEAEMDIKAKAESESLDKESLKPETQELDNSRKQRVEALCRKIRVSNLRNKLKV